MRHQSIAFSGLVALVFAAAPGCDLANLIGTEKATKTSSFSVPIPESGKCVVRTKNGGIRCVTGDVAEISVEATITARAGTVEEAEARLARISVDRSETDGGAEIVANIPRGVNGSVSMTVTIPSDTTLSLHSSNGEIDVTGVSGGVTGVTSNGSIRIVDCSGEIDVRSSNGKLSLEGESLADVKAKTSNGSVHIDGSLSPGSHEIRTSNGSIHADLTGTPVTITASTSHGKMTANGRKIKKGETVTLGVADDGAAPSAGDAAQLSLSTSNGSIKVTHQEAQETSPEDSEAEVETSQT